MRRWMSLGVVVLLVGAVIAPVAAGAAPMRVATTGLSDLVGCIATESELRDAAAVGGAYCVDASSPIVLTTGEVVVATRLALISTGPATL